MRLSDLITGEIIKMLNESSENVAEIQRNEFAELFGCAPSQINYVLNTRFTLNRGFVVESQRGGGGYIKVVRVKDNNSNFLKNALEICSQPISHLQGNQLLEHMVNRKLITSREGQILKSAISPKSLNNPINIDNRLRSNILQQVIIPGV